MTKTWTQKDIDKVKPNEFGWLVFPGNTKYPDEAQFGNEARFGKNCVAKSPYWAFV